MPSFSFVLQILLCFILFDRFSFLCEDTVLLHILDVVFPLTLPQRTIVFTE